MPVSVRRAPLGRESCHVPGFSCVALFYPERACLRFRRLSARAATVDGMSRPTRTSRQRRLLAIVLAAVAIGLLVVEPFPKGEVLLSLTPTHGVDSGDIPALAMLLVAAALAV
jgi:hypothetical protein